jgi:hypothetical protein
MTVENILVNSVVLFFIFMTVEKVLVKSTVLLFLIFMSGKVKLLILLMYKLFKSLFVTIQSLYKTALSHIT